MKREVIVTYSWESGEWEIIAPIDGHFPFQFVKAFKTKEECLGYIDETNGELILTEEKEDEQ